MINRQSIFIYFILGLMDMELISSFTLAPSSSTWCKHSRKSEIHFRNLSSSRLSVGSKDDDMEMFRDPESSNLSNIDFDSEDIQFVSADDDELSEEFLKEIQDNAPSQIEILKEILGINGFTYVLAALIAFFLGMNFALGPGWLGQLLQIPGTGTFTEISDSLPDTVDLSKPEFLL